MTRLTPQQVERLLGLLGRGQKPAEPEHVLDLAERVTGVRPAALAAVVERAPSVLVRLLDAEREAGALRWVIADVLAALDDGDSIVPGDLVARLRAVRVDVESDVEHALAVRQAEARAAALL